MSEPNSLNRAIKQSLRKGFIKWLLMGIVAGLIIGGSTALIIHFRTPAVQGPINEQETYTQHMAKQLQELVPAYEHINILGNGTSAVHERLIDAEFNRIYINDELAWNVSAFVLDFSSGEPVGETVSFIFNKTEVDAVAQGLYDSVVNTERVGTYGEPPYNLTELPNIYFGMELFLENHTYLSILILEDGLVFFGTGTWTSYENFSFNLIGAPIVSPASAFDHLTDVLHELFATHLG